LIGSSKQLVLNQFKDVQGWMTDSTDFGSDWMLYADGNFERARVEIYRHIDSLRQKWAKEWEFFGKAPTTIHQNLLADQYERSLWAGYILAALEGVEKNLAATKAGGRYTGDYLVRKAIEDAILSKLKQLNIVVGETSGGLQEQAKRVAEGSPQAEVDIDGSVDRYREALRLREWAANYMQNVRMVTERTFFPPAQNRTLPKL
jgi:hypothetical protein